MEIPLETLLEAIPRIRGLHIPSDAKVSHSVVIPLATYSPWLDDPEFRAVYTAIHPNTLVDIYRCHELWSLVGQTANVPGDILEVGVWRGGTGALMAARSQGLGSARRVYLCDTFTGVVKAGTHDSSYRGGEHADTSVEIVDALCRQLALGNVTLVQGIFPDESSRQLEDARLSLCHVDVDVYESARAITEWIWPRLAVGGVVVYDDYGFLSCDGITRFVNEMSGRSGAITLHNLNGHAVVVKTAN